jgi:hypothetical protein
MPTGEVRKLTTDPFERAAKREEQEEIRKEFLRQRMARGTLRRMRRRGGRTGMWIAVVVFGAPYALTALIRAAGFDFGEPAWGTSLVNFFFGGRLWLFGAYTGFMLLLLWAAAIVWVASRGD